MYEHVFVTDDLNPLVKRKGRPRSPETEIVIRTCRRHGDVAHGAHMDGGRKRYRCRRCIAEAVTRRHRRLRKQLIEEAGGACAVCGYARCELNLHFHHVNPAEKSFQMSVARGKSIAAYRAELLKCVLVWANCHGEIEAGLIASPPPLGEQRRAA
jgi:hypothetical protein